MIFIFINKLPTEVDELGHVDGNLNNETERQKALEKELNCVFIRINPDEKDFNIFKEIKKIYRDKTQSKEENKRTRKKNKIKEQKSKFANELLTYVSSISLPLNPSNIFLKKYFPYCKKMKKLTIKKKSDKNWKTIWNNVLFWVYRSYEEF